MAPLIEVRLLQAAALLADGLFGAICLYGFGWCLLQGWRPPWPTLHLEDTSWGLALAGAALCLIALLVAAAFLPLILTWTPATLTPR